MFISVLIATAISAKAQSPGDLDSTFGTNGIVTTAIGSGNDVASSVTIQQDGKIIVAGRSYNMGSNSDFALARYNANGLLDYTFSSDGIVTTNFDSNNFGSSDDYGYSVAIQQDGKIIVAGQSNIGPNLDFALVRYNANGSLDYTFSFDGIVTTDIGSGNDEGFSVAIQQDGKIIVVGWAYNYFSSNYDFALARYKLDGSLDNTFSSDGKVTTAIGSGNDVASSVAIQPDGKIIVAGKSYNGLNWDFALARYNADGSLDSTFSFDGKVTTAIGSGNDECSSVTIQPDGKIIVAGKSYNGSNRDFALARYNADGSLDSTFSSDGIVTTDIGSVSDEGSSVTIQQDGKIIVAGLSYNGSNWDFALARYNADGSLDNTFSSDGKVTTAIGSGNDEGTSVAIQQDGKIIVAGLSYNGSNSDFALARYIGGNGALIEEKGKSEGIKICPNPSNGLFTIEFNNSTYITTYIEVYNINMQKIYATEVKTDMCNINITGYANGLCFVKVINNNGITTGKIMLE